VPANVPVNVPVERIELAPGLTVSRLLTGLWQIADLERDGRSLDLEATAGAMTPYVEAGLTTFDMADHYGSAEEIVGLYARAEGRRPEALTKWVPPPGPISAEAVREAVERSLRRLRTDRIDLLQFHCWNYWDPSYLDGLFHLQNLRDEGLIGHLGLTNCDAAHLRVVLSSGIDIVSNQVCFSLLDTRAAGALTDLCLERGVKLLAYGTLAGGFLTDRWLGRDEPVARTWSEMKYKRFVDVAGGWQVLQSLLETLAPIAERLETTIAGIASRYVLDQPAVAGVIIGARLGESDHIAENLSLFGLEIDDESRTAIDEALRGLQPIPGDSGDEYRRPPFLTASGDLSHHIDEFPLPYEATEVDGRTRVTSGVGWEELAGYCRAIRSGGRISVSGTTASHGDHLIGGTDPEAQTHFVIDKIEAAIRSLGGRLEGVTRTRIFVQNLDDWEAIARVHGERFRHIRPANTLVGARLIGDEFLVEIEAEADVVG